MRHNCLRWRRSDLLPIAVLVLAAVLFWGFRNWSGARAAEVRDLPAAFAGRPALPGPDGGSSARVPRAVWPGNCCAMWQGGCGYPGGGGPVLDTRALGQSALEYYRQQTGDTGPGGKDGITGERRGSGELKGNQGTHQNGG